jgi:hypothetical protein
MSGELLKFGRELSIAWRGSALYPVERATETLTVSIYGGHHADAHDLLVQTDVPVTEVSAYQRVLWYGPAKFEIVISPTTGLWVCEVQISSPKKVAWLYPHGHRLTHVTPSYADPPNTITIYMPELLLRFTADGGVA